MPNRVFTQITRPSPALIERFRQIKPEALTPLLGEPGIMHGSIKPLCARNWQIVGPAITVAPDGTDMLMAIAATGIAQPGDVVVVAAGGDDGDSYAAWGGGLTLSARNRGVAAVIVDGLVMDTPAILSREVPVFCRGSTMHYRPAARPGSVNIPIVCGGVTVNPGDLIVADADGVLAIPQAMLERIIIVAEERTGRLIANGKRMIADQTTLFEQRGGPELYTALGVEWFD